MNGPSVTVVFPPVNRTRAPFSGGGSTVTDGPFTEAKEVVGGYWVIQARSKEEAVEWATRCPMSDGDMIEVRQVFDMSDFPEDVQQAAEGADVNPTAQPTER